MDSERVNESADLREWRRPVLRPISGVSQWLSGTLPPATETTSIGDVFAPPPS